MHNRRLMPEANGLVMLRGLDRKIGARCGPASLPDHTDSFQQRRNIGDQLLLAANDSR